MEEAKWKGRAVAELKGVSKDQVWPLLSDFYSLHKWFPHIQICHPVELEGVNAGQLPGLVRYCASTVTATEQPSYEEDRDGGDGMNEGKEDAEVQEIMVNWVKEKLTAIDQKDKWLSYEIVDNNMGFKSYASTMKLVDGGDETGGRGGCLIEWSFEADPVDGWREEDLVSLVGSSLLVMAKRMEDALL